MFNKSDTTPLIESAEVIPPKLFSKAGVVGLYVLVVGFFLSFQLLGIYLFAPMVFRDRNLTSEQRFGLGSLDGTVVSYAMIFTLIMLLLVIYAIVKWRIASKTHQLATDEGISPLEAKALFNGSVTDYLAIKSFPLYLAVAFIGLWLLFIMATEALTFILDKDPTAFVDGLYGSANPKWLLILVMVIVAPIYEEVMFRGILWRAVKEQFEGPKGVMVASIVTSLLFSVIHFQYDFFEISIIFFLALLLSFARAKSNSLILPIILHILNNGMAMWFYLIVN